MQKGSAKKASGHPPTLNPAAASASAALTQPHNVALPDERVDVIALKYLEMARDEILERMRYSNQLILFYVGAVSAFLGWVYTSSSAKMAAAQPATAQVAGQASLQAANQPPGFPFPVHLLVPVALVVAFLALAGSWILHENEYMIEKLAEYQKRHLVRHFRLVAKDLQMWECSDELTNSGLGHVFMGSMTVQTFLLNAPNVALVVGTWLLLRGAMYPHERLFFWAAAGLSVISLAICGWMMVRRYGFTRPTP